MVEDSKESTSIFNLVTHDDVLPEASSPNLAFAQSELILCLHRSAASGVLTAHTTAILQRTLDLPLLTSVSRFL